MMELTKLREEVEEWPPMGPMSIDKNRVLSVLVFAEKLKAAVVLHHAQRGDDRCWLDDAELYKAAGLGPAKTGLPQRDVFLANCARFHDTRQAPADPYVTVEQMVAEVRRERDANRDSLNVIADFLGVVHEDRKIINAVMELKKQWQKERDSR